MSAPSVLPRCLRIVYYSLLIASTWAANTSQWKPRAIYQTMTDRFARTDGSTTARCNAAERLYRGGTWRGMINQLDYIQGMGFDAVMISPIIKNVEGRVEYGEAYHGYWPINLYELNSHFGTEQDLLDLSAAVHERGMFLMMDTIINNMAYITNGSDPATSIDYSAIKPFNNANYFHKYCEIEDWDDPADYQKCQSGDDIVPLPDLYTEHDEVQQLQIKWAQDTIAKYSIDGLRIDAAKHVDTGFLTNYGKALSDTFMTGEVYQNSTDLICEYKDNYITSVPNFPIYYAIMDVFTQSMMDRLPNIVEIMKRSCQDTNALTLFTESHDIDRFGNKTDDIVLAKNVVTFNILFDGIPIIYQGQEQHFHGSYGPYNENREAIWLAGYNTEAVLYKHIRTMNRIRKHAYNMDPDWVNLQTVPIYQGASELAFRKGVEGRQLIMILSAQGTKQTGAYDIVLPVSYNPGLVVTEVISCVNYTASDIGEMTIHMGSADPQVLFPADLMPGSGLCGYAESNISYVELKTGHKSPTVSSSATSAMVPAQSMSITILFSLLMSISIAVLG